MAVEDQTPDVLGSLVPAASSSSSGRNGEVEPALLCRRHRTQPRFSSPTRRETTWLDSSQPRPIAYFIRMDAIEPGLDDTPAEAVLRVEIRDWMDAHAARFGRSTGPRRPLDTDEFVAESRAWQAELDS